LHICVKPAATNRPGAHHQLLEKEARHTACSSSSLPQFVIASPCLQHQQGGGAGHGRTPQLRNLTIDYWYDQSVAEKTEKKIKKKKKLLSIILPRRPGRWTIPHE